MPSEPQHGRRGHYRGRRGQDRHGSDRSRGARPAQRDSDTRPNKFDVDQIMRELRARIAAQHGVDLSSTQIEELAARRLEAVLAPGTADAALLDLLRQSAGTTSTKVPQPKSLPTYSFDDGTLYTSGNGIVRFVRRLLHPLLRLLFDPDQIVRAFGTQTRINAELTARERRRDARQTEWNALHFELVKRVVTENARAVVDAHTLTARVESLATKTDFNERRVREIEGAVHQARAPRQSQGQVDGAQTPNLEVAGENTDGGRRRRRRRRGRRNGGDAADGAPTTTGIGGMPTDAAASTVTETVERPSPDAADTTHAVERTDAPAEGSAPAPESDAHAPDAPLPSVTETPTGTTESVAPPAPVPAHDPEPTPTQPATPAADAGDSKWQQVFSPPTGRDSSKS
jgi:hypothetical protein